MQRARGHRRDIVERVQQEVERAFAAAKIKVQVGGREKTVYSIYRKMREKHTSFAQVSDIFGFRIVVSTLNECYLALGVLHQLYKPVPGRFKDYIAIPKLNGYQSLHTTLVSPLGTAVEFQIRTEPMHAVAESGIAAHWLYKTQGQGLCRGAASGHDVAAVAARHPGRDARRSRVPRAREDRSVARCGLRIHADEQDPRRCRAARRRWTSPTRSTPTSATIAWPPGSTANRWRCAPNCAAATWSRSSPPPARGRIPAWLNFVRTGRARSKIRHFLKTMELEESRALGERLFTQALRAEGLNLPSVDANDSAAAAVWQQLIRWSGNRTRGELLSDIAIGRKIAIIVAKRMARILAEHGTRPDAVTLTLGRYSSDDTVPAQGLVVVDGSEGTSMQLAPCCRPIPGDEIVGYLGRGEGLMLHTAECHVGKRLAERDPRALDAGRMGR